MAGKTQHYLPQFFQSGFSYAPGRKGGHMVWVFEPGKEPQKRNTKRIGAENYFYGKQGDELEVDTSITQMEAQEFSLTLRSLREDSKAKRPEPIATARLVTHLGIRVQYLRELMQIVWDAYTVFFENILANEDLTKALLKQHLLKELEHHVNSNQISTTQAEVDWVVRQIGNQIDSLPWNLFEEKSEELKEIFSKSRGTIIGGIKEGHIGALVKSVTPEKRVALVRDFEWRIEESRKPLILGDIGPFVVDSKGKVQPYVFPGDDIDQIFLPVSNERVLVGWRKKPPDFDPKFINEKSALLSTKFFIAKSPEETFKDLSKDMGLEYVDLVQNLITRSLLETFDIECE